MSTLGQKPATRHVSTEKQTITGNGGTSYTLQQSVSQASDIEVFVNNTRQEPAVAYNASGTTLTMTGAVNSSDSFYVIFQGKAIQTAGLPVDAAITASTMTLSETLSVTGATTLTGGVSGNPAFSGNVTVGGTLVNTGLITASAGVAIGGTGSANTLDDYEEGTFTPTWNGYASPYSTSGKYIKIGTQVFVYTKLVTNSGTDTSEVQIDNLPFSVSGDLGGGTVYHDRTSLYGYDISTKLTSNSTVCKLFTVTASSNVVGIKYVDSGEPTLGGFSTLVWTIFYQTT